MGPEGMIVGCGESLEGMIVGCGESPEGMNGPAQCSQPQSCLRSASSLRAARSRDDVTANAEPGSW